MDTLFSMPTKLGLPLAIILFCLNSGLQAQIESPATEFRAVWIATVNNIDYPKKPTTNSIAHKEQFKNLIKKFKSYGFNAVIVQVRPVADAFYPSELAPWSAYLTGSQGIPPLPETDLLQFMIEETHRQSMEFHAWLNPFRASMDTGTDQLAPGHILKKHPSWGISYGNKIYLNPGLPEVRTHITSVVTELVDKYDMDAIHFDDYFYPYPIAGEIFPDSAAYLAYGKNYGDIEDWRRANVDQLVQHLSEEIKKTKDYVKFGISPFGVWRNKDADPLGSPTRAGATSYDDLYADVVKWARMDWIDYVLPQLYWNIGFEPADYEKLLSWWSAALPETQLLIGHAAYKVGNNTVAAWHDPGEMGRQIQLNRKNPVVVGSAFFSATSILRNPLAVKDTLSNYYKYPALIPTLSGDSETAPEAPKLKRIRKRGGHPKLVWKNIRQSPYYYYVLYRFEENHSDDFEDGKNILHISSFAPDKRRLTFTDRQTSADTIYDYYLLGVNRKQVRSRPGDPRKIWVNKKGFKRVNWGAEKAAFFSLLK